MDDLRFKVLHDAASGAGRLAAPLAYPLALHIVTSRAPTLFADLPGTLATYAGISCNPSIRADSVGFAPLPNNAF